MKLKENRDLLVHTCFKGTMMEDWAHVQFANWSASLYESRWGEVVRFCRTLAPLLYDLKRFWREGRWRAGGHDDGGAKAQTRGENEVQFSPAKLTQTLKSSLFRAQVDLILQADDVGDFLRAYAESCPCHWRLRQAAHAMAERPQEVSRAHRAMQAVKKRHFGRP